MKEFEINLEELPDGITLVHVAGSLDGHTFEYMEQALTNLFENGSTRLIMSLEEVEYISSAGAGVFIGTLSESHERGGDIVLLNPTEPVQEVFDMLGLSQLFKLAHTTEEAVELLSRK
jgi:anti-sigma B factor antagonist